ncbi:type II secretion system F family protein [soil metagenome]
MDLMVILPIFLVLIGGAVTLAVVGVRASGDAISIEERLAAFAESPTSLEELELSLPFRQRVIAPIVVKLGGFFGRFLPHKNMEKLQRNLIEAGNPSKLGPVEFMGVRLALAIILSGSFFLLFLLTAGAATMTFLIPAVVGGIGYIFPGIWLSRKISQRKQEIQNSLADAIDLLSISVEAGLGFDPALARVTNKWDNALTDEFKRMLGEIQMGKSRREAMRELQARVNVDDLNVFISSLVQADQLGVSIAQILRVQSRQMRIRRRQRAEEKAQKAPIKMLFPMVFLIFPAMYVMILGPAIPSLAGGI